MKANPKLPDDIKELMVLVRAGKLFEVQKWIAEGKRIVPPQPYRSSPIRVAMETGFHSMIEVFLKAGVDQDEKDYLLNQAVSDKNFDLVTLLTDHGANIHTVDFEEVCSSGNPAMIRFFLDRGIDAVTNRAFAQALQHPKRPHLGIYLSYRDKIPDLTHQLNLALRFHASNGSLKWVCLLLWAGGDPYVVLPEIGEDPDPEMDTSALEEALRHKHIAIVNKIKIDPKKADLGRLLENACSGGEWTLIEQILDLGADPNKIENESTPIETLIWHLEWKLERLFGHPTDRDIENAITTIVKFADRGGRWTPQDNSRINSFRRSLYHSEPRWIERIVAAFLRHKVCANDVLLKLISTPRMKEVLSNRFDNLKAFVQGDVKKLNRFERLPPKT